MSEQEGREPDYLSVNRANWDARASIHAESGAYGVEDLLSDPAALSGVVSFDAPRLGRLDGCDVVHLQCHIGADTISLARLGAQSVTGLDFSGASIAEARRMAHRAGQEIEYVQADVYRAAEVLAGRKFDVVYTGIGALCWLPRVDRWAEVVAALLAPGGRLFIREGHPMLWAMGDHPTTARRTQSEGELSTPTLEFSYFEQAEPLVFGEGGTYVETDRELTATVTHEWNHGLGEIVTALLSAGLRVVALEEHTSVPWNALPRQMVADERGEWALAEAPERLAASYTLQAVKD